MPRIILINPVILQDDIFSDVYYPPIGLLQVATHYKKQGWEVEVWDMQLPNKYKLDKHHKPDAVGFNVIIGQPLKLALKLSKAYNRLGVPIIWGGAVARITPYLVPNYVTIDNNYYDEFPDYSLIDIKRYDPVIYTSIGCPYRCSFCYHNKDQKVQFDSVEKVINHVKHLQDNYGINSVKIYDDNFFTDKDRAIEILRRFKENNFKIRQVHSNINSLTDEVLNECKGVVNKIGISVEHGDPDVRRELFNKPIDENRVLEIVDNLKKLGITTIHNFIFGSPAWQLDYENFKFAQKIKDICQLSRCVGFSYASMPETPLTKQIEDQYGEFPRTIEFWQDFNMDNINIKYNPWLDQDIQENLTKMVKLFNDKYDTKGTHAKVR